MCICEIKLKIKQMKENRLDFVDLDTWKKRKKNNKSCSREENAGLFFISTNRQNRQR